MATTRHWERHRTHRIGWLRAAVLGANDGIVSTASLLLGVAAADASHGSILVAGLAGLVAGAMSMAAGEYVSVHSQADTEKPRISSASAARSRPTTSRAQRAHRDLHRPRARPASRAPGRGAAHGARRARRARARRARHLERRHARGRSRLRSPPREASRPAPRCRSRRGARGAANVIAIIAGVSLVSLAVLGGVAARAGGASDRDGRAARDVLGRARDGDHSGGGPLRRHGGLIAADATRHSA